MTLHRNKISARGPIGASQAAEQKKAQVVHRGAIAGAWPNVV